MNRTMTEKVKNMLRFEGPQKEQVIQNLLLLLNPRTCAEGQRKLYRLVHKPSQCQGVKTHAPKERSTL